jgi:hypothetical protein
VSSIKIGVVVGDAGKEKYFSDEGAGDKDFSGEVGAVKKTSSLLASESPQGRTNNSETMI